MIPLSETLPTNIKYRITTMLAYDIMHGWQEVPAGSWTEAAAAADFSLPNHIRVKRLFS